MESKTEPASAGIKIFLGILGAYPFNIYYMKVKDMIFIPE